jgi:hypothetical protein
MINGFFPASFLAPLFTLTNRSWLTSNMEATHTAGESQAYGNLWKSICAIIRSGSLTLPKRRKGARIFSRSRGAHLKAFGRSGRRSLAGTIRSCRRTMHCGADFMNLPVSQTVLRPIMPFSGMVDTQAVPGHLGVDAWLRTFVPAYLSDISCRQVPTG